MAKSFKQIAPKPETQKRTSEKDILDFLEQEHHPESDTAVKAQLVDNIINTSNTGAYDNTGNTGNHSDTSIHHNTSNTALSTDDVTDVTYVKVDVDVRQTFVIGQQYLDRLKDFVHTKRMSGQYEYTQKQALHDALDQLFEGTTIEERPAHIRQQEEKRKQQIRRGIAK